MKYFVIRKRVTSVDEQEADQIVCVVTKERIAVDMCRRYMNLCYEEVIEGEGKYLYKKIDW